MAPGSKSAVSDAAKEALDKDFPKSWYFDKDGDSVEGTFVKTDRGNTREWGVAPIIVLNVNGEERSIWCFHQALRSQVRNAKPKVGDRIAIRQLPKIKSGSSPNMYHPYRVVNLDAPEGSAEDLSMFDDPTSTPAPVQQQAMPAADDGDDIPF